jgi:hypothetical protein
MNKMLVDFLFALVQLLGKLPNAAGACLQRSHQLPANGLELLCCIHGENRSSGKRWSSLDP